MLSAPQQPPASSSSTATMPMTACSCGAAASRCASFPPSSDVAPQQQQQQQNDVNGIARLNDVGVNNLMAGNVAAAKVCFTEAVAIMKKSVRRGGEGATGTSRTSTDDAGCCRRRPPIYALKEVLRSASWCEGADANPNLLLLNNEGFVPAQGIFIGNSTRFFDSDVENTQMQTSIIIYNLALTFQMEAMMYHHPLSQTGQELLNKAHSLYVNSHRLLVPFLSNVRTQQSSHPDAAFVACLTDIIFMAILNNLAQISRDLQRGDEAWALTSQLIGLCEAIGARPYYTQAQQQQQTDASMAEFCQDGDGSAEHNSVTAIIDEIRKSALLNVATSQLPASSAAAA
eukprot:CAMPEP_0119564132 /NCGR_PEP_ID=MMETSP1352-20130426/25918_1 /TAXON_ID=265584 /ORGANISM="Stauroneis constricta, Strain CCMP1120" /LENGTH=342 /DNA_ID=CAMNT_0007612847 /DNA_START=78 /DNA_END=1106 /DNA_ORIENTATION=+